MAVLLARRYGPVPLVLSLAIFIIIAVSTVLLGWHYAVDAYAGAALAVGMWHASAALVRRVPYLAAVRPAYT